MSKLTRTLILAGTVAAMNLAGMTAIAHAQANDKGTTSQQQWAENWNYYQQATRVPPAELKARMQADATQRELSDRWTYYDHATRMSPAELNAWMQAKDRPGASTEPPAQVPAPVPRPSRRPRCPPRCGLPGRAGSRFGSSSPLGGWRRRWRSSLGWPCWPPGAPTEGLRSGRRPDQLTLAPLDGAAAPTRQPHHLAGSQRPRGCAAIRAEL